MAFTSLRQVLESVLKERKLASDIEAYKVFPIWGEIAGSTMANHCRPLDYAAIYSTLKWMIRSGSRNCAT